MDPDGLAGLQQDIMRLKEYVAGKPVHHLDQFVQQQAAELPQEDGMDLAHDAKYAGFLDKLVQGVVSAKLIMQAEVTRRLKNQDSKTRLSRHCQDSSPWLHAQLDVHPDQS